MLKNIFISEWERTFKRKKTWIGTVIYLFLVILECLFLYGGGGGVSFYNAEEPVFLNSLNTAPFLLRELGLFVSLIIIPMFVVDSFNGEYSSGAYRLILLRPQERFKLYFAKMSVQAVLIFALLAFTLAAGMIYGQLVYPKVTETAFYQTDTLLPFQSFMYVLTFYFIAYLVYLAVLTISSLISMLMPNSILSYAGIVGFLIGSIYISDHFSVFVFLSDSIFQIMAGENGIMLVLVFVLMVVGFGTNLLVWKKRDWLG